MSDESYIRQTDDYGLFTTLPGNRRVVKSHVRHLVRRMVESGNLTQSFPIVVNKRMEIIDGQHRLAALEELKWPVFYVVQDFMNVDNVRAINVGHRNWSWFDYAVSFSDLGNENYTRFLNLYQHFGYGYSILLYYCGYGHRRGSTGSFTKGEFELSPQMYQKAFNMLKQYGEVAEAADRHDREFATAVRDVMLSPNYNHGRMVAKMAKFGNKISDYRTKAEYLRAIEEVYNTYVNDEDKVRLF